MKWILWKGEIPTVDGRNPKHPPGMLLNPCFSSGINYRSLNWLAGFQPSTVLNIIMFMFDVKLGKPMLKRWTFLWILEPPQGIFKGNPN